MTEAADGLSDDLPADPRYSDAVRRRFRTPTAVGIAGDGAPRGYATEGGNGVRVEFTATVAGGRLEELRFRVFGCPHTIAAADWVCERFGGEPVEALDGFDVPGLTGALDVPVEKTGRILIVEDAIRSLSAAIKTR